MVGKLDFGELENEIKRQQSNKTERDVDWWYLPFGDSKMRILPPWAEGMKVNFFEVWVHYGFKDSQGNNRAYQCLKKYGEDCPICTRYEALKDSGDNEKANDIRPVKLYLYNVLDMEGNLRILTAKPTQHQEILQETKSHQVDAGINITDLDEGGIIKIERLRNKPWARARVVQDRIPLPDDIKKKIVEHIKDLSQVYDKFTTQELKDMLSGKDIGRVYEKQDAKKEETLVDAPVKEEAPFVEESPAEEKKISKQMSYDEIMEKLKEK